MRARIFPVGIFPVRILAGTAAAALFATATIAQSPPAADAPPPAASQPPQAKAVTDRNKKRTAVSNKAAGNLMRTVAPDMKAVLDALAKLEPKAVETVTPAEARRQPTPADAVKAVKSARGLAIEPDASVRTTEAAYGTDPLQKVRVYRPITTTEPASAALMPLVVYFHGGGWVFADLDVYDATPRALSKKLNAVVVSVEYRKAPEVKFPGQHDDAAAAFLWILDQARSWGADVERMAFAGESAGGNLAVATAIYARDNRLTAPKHVLAVYPIADTSADLPSRRDSADAKPLNSAMLPWFAYYYQKSPDDARDPRLNLVGADLKGLPPMTIVNAAIDPLRSDGETFTAALKRASVQATQKTFPGVTHEFFGMASVVKGAEAAQTFAVDRLRLALSPRRASDSNATKTNSTAAPKPTR